MSHVLKTSQFTLTIIDADHGRIKIADSDEHDFIFPDQAFATSLVRIGGSWSIFNDFVVVRTGELLLILGRIAEFKWTIILTPVTDDISYTYAPGGIIFSDCTKVVYDEEVFDRHVQTHPDLCEVVMKCSL
jgi:hypothetical protein